jgi:hypothetical protein
VKTGSNNTISRLFAAVIVLSAGALAAPIAANAQMPPAAQLKEMAEASSDRWVAFRNWNSRQWIYLTIPLTYHCGIEEMRYSLNGADLAERWPVPECNPQLPFNIDSEKAQVYLAFDPGAVNSVSLQLVYADGTESAVRTYKPCENAGEATCGALVE